MLSFRKEVNYENNKKSCAAAVLALSATLAFVACDKDDEASSTTFGGSLPASKGVNNFKGSYTSDDEKLVIEDSVIKYYRTNKSNEYVLTEEYKYSFQNTGNDSNEGTVYLTMGAFYNNGVRYTTIEDLLEMLKISELGNTDDMTADEKAAAELEWSLYKEPMYNQYKAMTKAVGKNTYSIENGVITLTPVFDKVSNLLNTKFLSDGLKKNFELDAKGLSNIALNSDDGKNLRFTAYVFVTKTPADSSTPEQSVETATLTATYEYDEETGELVLTFGDEVATLKEKYSNPAEGVSYSTILPYLIKTVTFKGDFEPITLTPITED
ncbi:MAG: hypothetical protein J6O39_03395 [Treponema sp.]|nr:hypothetical protein [Treponema sp.]